MSLQAVGEIVANVLEVIANGGDIGRKPAPPNEAPVEPLVMAFGAFIVIFGCFGCALYLDQWKQQWRAETQPAALASIVSLERKQSGSDRFTEMWLDFERPTAAGPVACRSALVQLRSWPVGLETGKMIEVYPQPGSCYRPTYAPEVGSPRATLIFSLAAFPIGALLFGAGYASLRNRRRRTGPLATPSTTRSGL